MLQKVETKERPILFSAPMVCAILDGRKTQTRRIIKPVGFVESAHQHGVEFTLGRHSPKHYGLWANSKEFLWCPFGGPGDRLWARETWGEYIQDIGDVRQDRWFVYRADENGSPSDNGTTTPWKPSVHMPHSASRILLKITDVRVEHLQDISNEDAKAEGMFFTDYGRKCGHIPGGGWVDYDPARCDAPIEHHQQREGWMWDKTTSASECLLTARFAFANLWCQINGENGWIENPWVWVISFRRLD